MTHGPFVRSVPVPMLPVTRLSVTSCENYAATALSFAKSIRPKSSFPSGVVSARSKQLCRVGMINLVQSLTAKPESI